MDKNILEQYSELKEEIKDLRKRIHRVEKQLEKIESEGTVIDSVTGTRKDGTFGSIRIEGVPCVSYDRKVKLLYKYKLKITSAEARLLELTNEVEEYINSVEDSKMRRILQYRIIDNMSWYDVADRMGGKATSESCRKYYERFLNKS